MTEPRSLQQPRERIKIRERLRRPGWRLLGALALAFAIGTMPVWGRRVLARFEFFRLHHVEVRGVRYLAPETVVMRMRADTLRSIWDDTKIFRRRLAGHPQIRDVAIARRPPSTLVVTVTENLPVALVATRMALQPYDAAGHALPLDPSRTPVDLPVLLVPDPALLAALGRVSVAEPRLFARISTARRDGRDALVLQLESLRVRAPLGVSASRLADIFPVESDLARRGLHVAELDLRYRDQVIARPQ